MTEFHFTGDRVDVDFGGDEDLQIARTILAICAYPEAKNLQHQGAAHKFFDAMNAYVLRLARKEGALAKLPTGLPKPRDVLIRLDRGAYLIDRFRGLHCALVSHLFTGGIRVEPSPDMQRFNVRIVLGGPPDATPKPKSVSQILRYHQEYLCLGDGSEESSRDLAKRVVRPLMRVSHIIALLHSRVLGLKLEPNKDWFFHLLFDDPSWARTLVEKSELMSRIEVSGWRQLGLRSASPDRMVHLRLS